MKITYSEAAETGADTLSVASFLAQINTSLSARRGRIAGEVTSIKTSYQTAIYFTIKDPTQEAILNCVMWRTTYNQNGLTLKEGDHIIVTGTPEIYAARGTFSLKVQTVEYAGAGQLKQAYEELKRSLTTEGLLAPVRKRRLPDYPQRIGVITSQSGVVIQDFSANLGRYGFAVSMVDSRVEGKDAIHEILTAIKTLSTADIEVLVIMRGGGSLESLQAFNTESVVRAIAAFPCPVLTGIGHDVDVTLSELVADVAASTPTAVAEALNESWDRLLSGLETATMRVVSAFERAVSTVTRALSADSAVVVRTYTRAISVTDKQVGVQANQIQSAFRRLERTIVQAGSAVRQVVGTMKSALRDASRQLVVVIPQNVGAEWERRIALAHKRRTESARGILAAEAMCLRRATELLAISERQIRAADPARNLKLGYSLSYQQGKLLRSVSDLAIGAVIETQLADGSFTSEVKQVL